MRLQKIKFLKGVKEFQTAEGGYSGAEKLLFEKNNKRYFIKIGKFSVRDDLEELFSGAGIPHPKVIESGVYDEENNYIIEEFSEGIPLKFKLDDYNEKFVYEFGYRIGEKYRNLRKIFPDKPMSEEAYSRYMQEVDKRLEGLISTVRENKDRLTKSQIDFLKYINNFLSKNRKLVKNSVMVFGHTDAKPSNFLVKEREINVIDFEHTDYKELSLSLLWAFCRVDFKDDKNYAFANGYIDGLFNFDVPKNFLKCCNYTYLFNMCKYCYDYIKKDEFGKLDKLIKYIKHNYMKDGKIQVDKHLSKVARIEDFSMLKGFEINFMEGSFSPHNLTFKCVNDYKKYFLKIMKMTKKRFGTLYSLYSLMQDLGVSISPVRFSGSCKGTDRFFVVYDFIEEPEMNVTAKSLTFEEGVKLGQIVGRELKKLKGYKSKSVGKFDINDLYKKLISNVEIIFGEKDESQFIELNKKETLFFINKLIKSFEDEPIDLIHGDVKFGNILFDGENKVVFVDNESLVYSYDIINFIYNILSGFNGNSVSLYQGFVNGYLKYMNDGQIPQRIQGQVKLLLLARLLREIVHILNKRCSGRKLEILNSLCQQFVVKDEEILWLR